jgi:hypothetical protein
VRVKVRFSTTAAAKPLSPSLSETWEVSSVINMWGARFVWREEGREDESVLRFGKGAGKGNGEEERS